MARKAKINRKTKETNISVEANLDGKGSYKIDTKMSAEEIAKKSIQVASEICVYTNNNITLEKI